MFCILLANLRKQVKVPYNLLHVIKIICCLNVILCTYIIIIISSGINHGNMKIMHLLHCVLHAIKKGIRIIKFHYFQKIKKYLQLIYQFVTDAMEADIFLSIIII